MSKTPRRPPKRTALRVLPPLEPQSRNQHSARTDVAFAWPCAFTTSFNAASTQSPRPSFSAKVRANEIAASSTTAVHSTTLLAACSFLLSTPAILASSPWSPSQYCIWFAPIQYIFSTSCQHKIFTDLDKGITYGTFIRAVHCHHDALTQLRRDGVRSHVRSENPEERLEHFRVVIQAASCIPRLLVG
eukprot:3372624-Rhodomonas_salina.1